MITWNTRYFHVVDAENIEISVENAGDVREIAFRTLRKTTHRSRIMHNLSDISGGLSGDQMMPFPGSTLETTEHSGQFSIKRHSAN